MIKYKKIMAVAMTAALTVSFGGLPIGNNVIVAHASTQSAQETRHVVAAYYVSKANVKTMAAQMKASTSGNATIAEYVIGLANPYVGALMLATALSSSAQYRAVVVTAASHNNRVEVIITDSSMHTSYSTQTQFIEHI